MAIKTKAGVIVHINSINVDQDKQFPIYMDYIFTLN